MNQQELSFLAMSREMIISEETFLDKVDGQTPKDDKRQGKTG